MWHWALSAAIGAGLLISNSGSASPAQAVVSGIYDLDIERSDNVFRAIDSATADVASDKRLLTRMRLRKSTAIGRIRLSIAENRLGIAYDAKAPIVVFLGGEPVKWKLIDVLVFDVSARANGDGITVTFRSDDSERTTTYCNVGQDLVADTSITSPLFRTPLVYKQVYRRVN